MTAFCRLALYLVATLWHVQASLAQTSTVNGQAVYSATPVAANAYGIPTLTYNCARMPAICNNVNQRNPLQSYGNGWKGTLLGTPYLELNFDTDEGRKHSRRSSVCPNRWSKIHPCPEVDQPKTVDKDRTVRGGWLPARYNPNNLVMGQPGYNRIADSAGQDSDMIWTCDEWPPASTVEGGAGQAQTYCAPQSAACAGGPGRRSEQDWQASVHAALRRHLDETTWNPVGVYTFHFTTVFKNDPKMPAAYVTYYDDPHEGSGLHDGIWTRSDKPTHLMTEAFYTNRTSSVHKRPLKEQEHAIATVRRRNNGRLTLDNNITAGVNVAHQAFESLPKAPILPFIDISTNFLREQAELPVLSYFDQFSDVLNRTRGIVSDVFDNLTGLRKRKPRGKVQCGPGRPCPDGSCCNNDGGCGFGPENCGAGNCTSNCDATAMCGRDSLHGNVSCPLNVCCSYYGYCNTDADFCESTNPNAPCQQGFGSCSIVPAPSCSGDSANGRTVAYYQIGNIRERQCNRIFPSQINATGLTHLNLAFASIEPTTFEVVPGNSQDVDIYPEFTGLKSLTLQTWIAIGGWDFNDAGSTQSTWSTLASSRENRATFISSVKSFMDQYGFQGVDIDWEYPGAPDRYGEPQDTKNFVTLVQEMKAAFGTNYGISVTLPASYWYLRWFDPKAMEPYVDFFGLMTYDLHGPWDANVESIGQIVYGQTNIPEIANWTLPLWYDRVDPSKINMGLAYYGRGYTLRNESCNTIGCAWTGLSRPGPCTNFPGVMSLQEIEDNVIPALGVQPTQLEKEMMKQLTWGNQWIGYDDMETIAMKKQWASSHCFGGTMIWSIDLYSGPGSGDTPDGQGSSSSSDPGSGGGQEGSSEGGSSAIVYIDPSIWQDSEPIVQCEPPCTFILPPLQLSTATTITFPPYTTSLDVAWSESTGWTSTVQTTTLTIPPLTTTAIEVWEHTISDASTETGTDITSSFYVTSSVRPPPFTITNEYPQTTSGPSHPPVIRTITPPPYPYSFVTPDGESPSATTTTTSSSVPPVAGAIFPKVTYKPGKPGPICQTGCGEPCLIFCDYPCLLDCPDSPNDFADPNNPDPPPQPSPTPPTTPLPPAKTIPPPEDPQQTDPPDPETEEIDQECALEFGLPLPTYSGPIGESTSTVSVAPPPPPPSPSPPPPPAPPSPNPDTETLHCYDSGSWISRADAIQAVDNFCNKYDGTVLDASKPNTLRTLINYSYEDCIFVDSCFVQTIVSVTVINGCRFTVDGPSASEECGRILREAVDQCDTSSTQYKQGGTVSSNCAQWRIDPGCYWG